MPGRNSALLTVRRTGRRPAFFSLTVKTPAFYLPLLWVVFVFLSCAGPFYQFSPVALEKTFQDAAQFEKQYPGENALLLLDHGELEIFKSNQIAYSSFKRHRVVKILTKDGVSRANVTIPYSGSTTVPEIRARTIKADGTIFELDPEDIYDISLYPGFIFYADIRAKRFTLPGVEPGCVIEYGYEKNMRQFTYWDSWSFQNDIPTLLSRYKVRAPAEWDIRWRMQNIDITPQTAEVPAGFKQDYVWEARDLAPLVPETAMPPYKNTAASVIFSPVGVKNWKDVAHWYHELFYPRAKPDKSIREKTADLTADCRSDREKLENIYEFCRDYVRYVAISIGIGGYQPHFASEVLHNRFGDCKDKVCLMSAMASAAGLQVDPVLISTWQNGNVDTSLASHIFFNHVIGCAQLADGSRVWMDPTSEPSCFQDLPWFDRDRRVLCIQKDRTYRWLKTPSSKPQQTITSRNWTVEIESDSVLLLHMNAQITGARALIGRGALAGRRTSQRKKWLKSTFLSGFAAVRVDTFNVENQNRLQLPLKIRAVFRAAVKPGAFLRIGDFCGAGLDGLFSEQSRRYDVRLPYGFQTVDTINILHPPDKNPKVGRYINRPAVPFGSCTLEVRENPGELYIQRVFTLRENRIGIDDYKNFKHFIDAVAILDRTAIIFADGR